MNIVQINYACDPDLTDPDALLARYVTLTGWSGALVSAGARVTVLQRFPKRAEVTRGGVDYVFAPSPNAHVSLWPQEPDLAHVNGLTFPRDTWWLRRRLPSVSAIVIQDHGSLPGVGRGPVAAVRRWLRRAALGVADGFLFAAAQQVDPWRRAGLIAQHQQVYDVMEASTTFAPVPRDAARLATNLRGSPAVLWVGRLNGNKDPLTVLNGFERSLTSLPEATLTMIYSEDDLLPEVRARIAASPALGPRVRLVGAVPHDDLPAFYSAADVFVAGSHHEGSGYSLIEACACGLPPVVTGIPSFRAITGAGAIGAFWEPGDAVGFAHALVDFCGRDLVSMRTLVRAHFERALGWPAVGRRALEIYRDVVARRSRLAAASSL